MCLGVVFALSCAKAAPETNASVNILSEQTEALEKQMKSLQSQLQQLKQQQAALVSAPSKEAKSKLKPKQTTPSHSSKPTLFGVRGKEASKTDGDKQILRGNPSGTLGSQTANAKNTNTWLHVRGTSVVTSPYFGPQPQFDGSSTLVTQSSVNKDLLLLQVLSLIHI